LASWLGPLRKDELEVLDEGLEQLIDEAKETLEDHKQDPIVDFDAPTLKEAVESADTFLETLHVARERLTILQRWRAMVKAALEAFR
jgi:hypothetical protein